MSGVFVLAMTGCTRQVAPTTPPDVTTTAATGASAADFTGHDLDGRQVRLSTLLGEKQVVLLSFSVTFCEPCVEEFPHLRAIYEANKARGFVILGIAMDEPETVANVPGFARRNRLNFPVITDEDSHIALLYNPKKTAPMTVLIDRSGKIVMVRAGYRPGDEKLLEAEISNALGDSLLPANGSRPARALP